VVVINNLSWFPLLARLIFWLVMLVMTALFLVPQEFVSGVIFDWWDKAQHALAFGVLMLLGFIAYSMHFWRVAIGLILYGTIIEIIQSWTGWRQGDVMDALADTVGVLVIALLIHGYQNHCIRHEH
jgi:hypothetical protein